MPDVLGLNWSKLIEVPALPLVCGGRQCTSDPCRGSAETFDSPAAITCHAPDLGRRTESGRDDVVFVHLHHPVSRLDVRKMAARQRRQRTRQET